MGVLRARGEVRWRFPEFEKDFPIRVEKIEGDRYVSFRWEIGGEWLLVEMTLAPVEGGGAVVTVTEKGIRMMRLVSSGLYRTRRDGQTSSPASKHTSNTTST